MSEFFSTHEAALALHKGLAEVAAIGPDHWGREIPLKYQQDRDRAAAKVGAAVRYLCAEADAP